MISAATRRRLPIGIQTFREVREEGHYYVDKTGFALQLVTEGKHFFLSRPRRFGKSLLVDTLKELFEGNRELFEGWMPTAAGTGRCGISSSGLTSVPAISTSWEDSGQVCRINSAHWNGPPPANAFRRRRPGA